MKFIRNWLVRKRIRKARRKLAQTPSAQAYEDLAQEYALLGMTREVVRTCEEGLAVFPGYTQLVRVAERAKRVEIDRRIGELKRELAEAPRPALLAEYCEILIDSGDLAKAEEQARAWIDFHDDRNSRLMMARVCVQRFFADRGRDQGREAIAALKCARELQPHDPRPLRLELELLSKIGAWKEARVCVSQLLELEPGSPELEARYRTYESTEDEAPSVDRALIEVERTGHFADDEAAPAQEGGTANVRPLLRDLAGQPDIHAALYVRGGTALVQGPKGATAERTARSVRTILQSSRSTARRLGLGQLLQVQLEGGFGNLSLAPGEMDAGAIWSRGPLGRAREDALLGLAGINADLTEVEA